jgi:leucyl-tRNA synthetase
MAQTLSGTQPRTGRVRRFNHREIEARWQARWTADRLYEAEADSTRPKHYALVMFPYTSGDLHLGHWWNFAIADVHARYKRMRGYNVLFPAGFDAFGLPAEGAAIRHGIHPYTWTMENIAMMERQWRTMGGSYDWSKEVATCLPEYYKWNQWFFLQFYKNGLAYKHKAPVNWCPKDQAVLANEQVHNGRCWRCDTPVIKRDLEQWFFRITKYADELLDFSEIEWPERICKMQTDWIGRSEGVEFRLPVVDQPDVEIAAYTTRIDTVFGMTYVVLAPEHELVARLTAPERRAEVDAYVDQTGRQTEIERLSTEKEKTGVFIGSYAINPANGQRVPIWIADYVLASYGTGAIMAVPASDERDWEFAKKFGLPIRVVVRPPDDPTATEPDRLPGNRAYVAHGVMVNSGQFDGLPNSEAIERIADWFEARGIGQRRVNYRMRDWLISRQRYWGTPIPMIYCPTDGIVPVPEADLPVLLPADVEFETAQGENPLKLSQAFVNTTCPTCGGPAQRETDTMDTFMDSSWYFLRYTSPGWDEAPGYDRDRVRYWLPVDQYMGGAEHAVMHLLYTRFFIRVLRDLGLVDFNEPFIRLYNQGEVLGPDGKRMSKSHGNVVNPDEHVERSGADTVRGWLMFLGPWDQGGPVNMSAIGAILDLLQHTWDLASSPGPVQEHGPADRELRRLTHATVKGITHDLEGFRFNTLIAKLMIFRNELRRVQTAGEGGAGSAAWDEAIDVLLLLSAPAFPHLAEELWTVVRGRPYSIHQQSWPGWDESLLAQDTLTLAVQINGRVRDQLVVAADIARNEEQVREQALQLARLQPYLSAGVVQRVVVVPGKLVNIVVK